MRCWSNGTNQGQHACQGGTSLPGGQAAIWLDESALSATGEEHGAIEYAVHAVPAVDGAAQFNDDRIGAPAGAGNRLEMG